MADIQWLLIASVENKWNLSLLTIFHNLFENTFSWLETLHFDQNVLRRAREEINHNFYKPDLLDQKK